VRWVHRSTLKVFIAATSLHATYGGPAISVLRLAEAVAATGLEIGLWTADGPITESKRRSHSPAIRILSGDLTQAFRSFGKPDVVHDNGIWRFHNHQLAKVSKTFGIPRVVSTRGMLEPWALAHKRSKKRLAWWLYQRSDLQRAQCHHVSSEPEQRNVKRLELGVPVRMISNGIDVPETVPARPKRGCGTSFESNKKTALFLGRIHPVKGLRILIEAWARVRPSGWQLQIAGPDEAGHQAELEQTVSARSLSDVVTFVGPLVGEAKSEKLFDADLFVLPTYSESFGMAIGESLAHGLPVLTTTGAPWPTLAERGYGWQVDTTVEALVEGLRRSTALDRETLRRMGSRGRDFIAQEFGWDRIASEFARLYKDLTQASAVKES
jgi:glycosyltransferase involved in cell wall biosynthesis